MERERGSKVERMDGNFTPGTQWYGWCVCVCVCVCVDG